MRYIRIYGIYQRSTISTEFSFLFQRYRGPGMSLKFHEENVFKNLGSLMDKVIIFGQWFHLIFMI